MSKTIVLVVWSASLLLSTSVHLARAGHPLMSREPPVPPAVQRTLPAADEMACHLERTRRIHDALLRGDLRGLRRDAGELAREGVAWPGPWSKGVWALRRAAGRVLDAATLTSAGRRLAELGATCARCHQELGARVRISRSSGPPPASGAQPRMLRHRWAQQRLWEGLVTPSDRRWRMGARLLARDVAHPRGIATATSVNRDVLRLARWEIALGKKAIRAVTARQRTGVYGNLMGTCAGCHELLRAPRMPEIP
jgi:cytochrome c553